MKMVLIAVAAKLHAATFPAWADFAAGVQAYDSGDYETAFAEWGALAASGDAQAQVAIAGVVPVRRGKTRSRHGQGGLLVPPRRRTG